MWRRHIIFRLYNMAYTAPSPASWTFKCHHIAHAINRLPEARNVVVQHFLALSWGLLFNQTCWTCLNQPPEMNLERLITGTLWRWKQFAVWWWLVMPSSRCNDVIRWRSDKWWQCQWWTFHNAVYHLWCLFIRRQCWPLQQFTYLSHWQSPNQYN